MSAMMAVVKADGVHVLADAAFYRMDDGTLVDVAPKIWRIPGTEAVFVSRGAMGLFPLFALACSDMNLEGYDDFRRRSDEVFALFDALTAAHLAGAAGEILIVGWSAEAGCGEVLFRHTHTFNTDLSAGLVYLFRDDVVAFGPFETAWAVPPAVASFDPIRDGVRLFEVARRTPADLTCGDGEPCLGYSVGGFLSHAVISESGVSPLETLRSWPDRIGERISPDADVAIAA